MIMVIAFVTGLIYTPAINWNFVFADMEFLIAYFIEIFGFLSFALMLGVLIQKPGLTIILLLLARMLEYIVRENIDEVLPWIIPFLPLESLSNLVPFPFQRYAFQEIRDYLTLSSIAIALGWTLLFNYFSYIKLKFSDI
jgi:hypothetical protein